MRKRMPGHAGKIVTEAAAPFPDHLALPTLISKLLTTMPKNTVVGNTISDRKLWVKNVLVLPYPKGRIVSNVWFFKTIDNL